MWDFEAHARAAALNRSKPEALGVVHLVWAPLGPEPVRSFVRSYRAHPPGIAHELVIVLNGAPGDAREARSRADATLTREGLAAELAGIEHRLIVLEEPVLDLAAYGLAARALNHPRLCFLNSYSVILADGWLAILAGALDDPGTGLVGTTASWESQSRWVRGRARYWPYQLARLRSARRDYPRYPNPHIRTTAFMIERAILLAMNLDAAHDKRDTYLLESGRRSITRQVLERALRAVVVGRDGRVYGVKDWAASRTYRSGEQDNLLVADRRTADWQSASPRLRRRLSRDAWGEHYVGASGGEGP
ncbi:MAG TPA: hypothetical protein VG053_07650 [Solirubrobacteraceae bacterium]|jgi:hypothetical protein|nr:hypothetical protein [Solirubrobacteraceae bacterium]